MSDLALFNPINDKCVDCDKDIKPRDERNYIVFEKNQCRRQCAKCHDKHAMPVSRTGGHTDRMG